MKTSLLLTLCLASTVALAQNPISPPMPNRMRVINQNTPAQESTPAFPENYLVALTLTEQDKPLTELVVTTARAEFKADTTEPSMTFFGTLTPEENGTVLVSYALGAEVAIPTQTTTPVSGKGEEGTAKVTSFQYKSQSAQATVCVRLGEALNILKTGNRVYRLMITKLPAGATKTP